MRNIGLVLMLAMLFLCACEREHSKNVELAVKTGSLVKGVVVTEGAMVITYSYEYDGADNLDKVTVSYSNSSEVQEYAYTKKGPSEMEIVDQIYTHTLDLNGTGCIERYTLMYDSDIASVIEFVYSGAQVKNVIMGDDVALDYEWNGDDISLIGNKRSNICHEYRYSEIVDNFNVSIPQLTYIYGTPFAFFTKLGASSRHLESSSSHFIDEASSHRTLSYERNSSGDIFLIKSTDGRSWEILY